MCSNRRLKDRQAIQFIMICARAGCDHFTVILFYDLDGPIYLKSAGQEFPAPTGYKFPAFFQALDQLFSWKQDLVGEGCTTPFVCPYTLDLVAIVTDGLD
jgi:hypothetical protein